MEKWRATECLWSIRTDPNNITSSNQRRKSKEGFTPMCKFALTRLSPLSHTVQGMGSRDRSLENR